MYDSKDKSRQLKPSTLNVQQTPLTKFTENIAAKRIQRVFRAYLLWKKLKKRNEMSVERRKQ